MEFGKACEDFSWNRCTSTPLRSETNGIADRAVRRVKEGASAVLLQSGLDENWWADSMECYTYLRNIQDLLSDGKISYERRSGGPLIGPIIPFDSLVEYYPISAKKTSQESINLERKSYLDYSLDTLCTRGEFGRVTYWLQTMRSWKRWTHRKSTLEKTQCKGRNISQRKWKIHFPAAERRIKLSGGDEELRTRTLIREHPIRGESQREFLGESEGSLPPPQDSFPHASEEINDFWSMSGNFIFRHHVESRVRHFSPREESFPVPLKYIDVSRTTRTNLDVMQERRIDRWVKRFV